MGRPLLMDSNDQHRQKKRRSFFFLFLLSLSLSLFPSLPFLSSLTRIHSHILHLPYERNVTTRAFSLALPPLFHHLFKRTLRFLPPSTTPFIPLPLNYVFTLASSDARGFRPTLEYTSNLEHAVAAKLKRKWGGKRDLGSRGK